jgi:FkbM family methyltransferase
MTNAQYIRRFWNVLPRIVLWRLISALKIDAFHSIPGLPFKMSLEPTFRSVGSLAIFALGKDYESLIQYLPNLVAAGDTCIDCGANQGIYSMYLASLAGNEGRVIAVEPQEYAAKRIRLSSIYNGFERVEVLSSAISSSQGFADFRISDELVSAGLHRTTGRILRVKTTSIDSLAEEYGLQRISFIKLDVEGAELDALVGSRSVIARDKPTIMFELLDDPFGERANGIWHELTSSGYRICRVTNGALIDVTNERASGFDLLAINENGAERLKASSAEKARHAA